MAPWPSCAPTVWSGPSADRIETGPRALGGVVFVLIGLCGGTVEARQEVTATLVDKAGRGIGGWEHGGGMRGARPCVARDWHRELARENALRALLDGLPALKARTPDAGLVVSHALNETEVEMIKKAGGYIWHLAGPVSAVVPIARDDLLVTPTEGGERHFLDPLEALAEQLLRQGAAA